MKLVLIAMIKGFSFIEVLIATLINSVLMIGLLSMLANSGALQQQSITSTNRLNDINFAIQQLSISASHAVTAKLENNTYSYFYTGQCGIHSSCTHESSAGSQIAIIQPNPINADNKDCTGQGANINPTDVLVSVYWVDRNSHGSQSLYCRGYNLTQNRWVRNGRSAALVDRIERLDVRYLVDDSTYESRGYHYQPAQSIRDWAFVVAIKVDISSQGNSTQLNIPLQNIQALVPLINNSGLFQ